MTTTPTTQWKATSGGHSPQLDDTLLALQRQLSDVSAQLDVLTRRQRATDELLAEAGPILKEVMKTATGKLQAAEEAGWFAFGRAGMRLVERVVTSYSEEDVDQLGEAVVSILDTVRSVTQPDMLSTVNEVADVMHDADGLTPVGMMGALRASRDEDVRKGMAIVVEVLRHVGRSANHAAAASPARRPVRAASRPAPPVARAPRPPRAPRATAAASAVISVDGVELDEGGFLVDPTAWTRDLAPKLAAPLGIDELTPDHWQVIDFARKAWEETGASPNIRKLSVGSGVGTRDIYRLFRKAPGKAVARCAGIPKPAGCI